VGRFSNSWSIAKASWSVLKDDKELMVLPVINAVVQMLLTGVVLALVWFLAVEEGSDPSTLSSSSSSAENTINTPVAVVIGIVGTYLMYFATTYFLAALVAGAHQRFSGSDPTLGSSFATASKRIPQIVGWSALDATVGMILRTIQQRAGFIGAIVVSLIGLAWELVTWLAVPVLVIEGTGPIESLKRSAGLFKKTWGENVIGNFGLGLVGFLAMLPGFLIGGGLIWLGPTVNIVVGVAIILVSVFVVGMFMATLTGIFRTALYIFATTGQVPAPYDQTQVTQAFTPKRGLLR
jgi:hypothetical protein